MKHVLWTVPSIAPILVTRLHSTDGQFFKRLERMQGLLYVSERHTPNDSVHVMYSNRHCSVYLKVCGSAYARRSLIFLMAIQSALGCSKAQ